MKTNARHIIPAFILIACFACKKVTQEELISSAVEIKIKQWRDEQISTCKQKALTEAEDYVDSVLVATSLENKLDTLLKPDKPVKPDKPIFKTKPDSVVVDPIYKEE